MISDNEKYWKDYTDFIESVESLTGFSPASLLEIYQELVTKLDNGKEYYESYAYEEDIFIRKQIQEIIEYPSLSNNILFEEFRDKIEKLDSEFKKHIENNNDLKWWEKLNF